LALDQQYIDSFLSGLNSFSDDYPPEIVFNMDEACWTAFEASRKTGEKLRAMNGGKTSFTALDAIFCAGETLSLWVLAKGRTDRCEPK
jgi:hypothetical protein